MPTYQYACTDPACHHEFELVQSFTDPAASECPVCGHSVRKKFSAVGVVFKGSGFYRTDSRSEAKSGSGSADGSAKNGKTGEAGSGGSKAATPAKESASTAASSASTGTSSSGTSGGGASRAAASA